jgi:hypothetical protein
MIRNNSKYIIPALLIFFIWRKLKAGISGGLDLLAIGTIGSAVDAGALFQDYTKNKDKYPSGIKGIKAEGLMFIPTSREQREMVIFTSKQGGGYIQEAFEPVGGAFSFLIDEMIFTGGKVYAKSKKEPTMIVTPTESYNGHEFFLVQILSPNEIQNK